MSVIILPDERHPPSRTRRELLNGSAWEARSCWLDVTCEFLHTLSVYGMRGLNNPSAVKGRERLFLEALIARSEPDATKARASKSAAWRAAKEQHVALVPAFGSDGDAATTVTPFQELDPDFTTAKMERTCNTCGRRETQRSAVFLRSPSDTWPHDRWVPCLKCNSKSFTTTVTEIPAIVGLYGEKAGTAGDGTIPTLLHKFDRPYVLVFAPINDLANEHFVAHVRLGNHWYFYDPGWSDEARQLRPKSVTNPKCNEGCVLGELLYVRQDILAGVATELESELGADPVAGPPLPPCTVAVARAPAQVRAKKGEGVVDLRGE